MINFTIDGNGMTMVSVLFGYKSLIENKYSELVEIDLLSLGAAEVAVASTVGLSGLEYLQYLCIPFPPLSAI